MPVVSRNSYKNQYTSILEYKTVLLKENTIIFSFIVEKEVIIDKVYLQ